MDAWIFAAGMACLIVSAIWLIVAHLAGLRTRKAIVAWTCIIAATGSALGLLGVRAAVNYDSVAVDHFDLAAMFLTWLTVVGLAASLVLVLASWTAHGLTLLHRLLIDRLLRR
jgi:hypothetical protein